MEVVVTSRAGKEMGTYTIDITTTLSGFKDEFARAHPYSPNRQRFTINDAKGVVLADN